jgi:predicted nucleotidyltransferase
MIPEPQKTYLLELLTTLGPAADEFVLVGGQALKFVLAKARTTKDFDSFWMRSQCGRGRQT